MTRNQYWTLIGGSCLVAVLLLTQILCARSSQYAHLEVLAAEQVVAQGHTSDARLRQLAARIYQLSVQTQDQGLKDLLARQQIVVQPPTNSTSAPAAQAPANESR